MISLINATLRRGKNVLLDKINWTIYHKQRIGIIGANGSGKTSMFAMLLGKLALDEGDLTIPSQIKMAHVEQETPAYHRSALDYALDGDVELRELEDTLRIAEEQDDGNMIATVYDKMSVIDAYTAPSRAAQLLIGLGFHHHEINMAVSEFSGGWRVRLNLAKALMARSDILLLDEPTNHLDLDAVLWLEQWLLKYPGTLLLISHDRDFLDKTVDHIAHIDHSQMKLYSGNYSTFETQRANDLLVQQSTYEKQQARLAHMQSYVDRFRYKASKARQAQSRMKAIERMDLMCAVHTESQFQFEFRVPSQCPTPLIKLEKANIAYGEKKVLNRVDLNLTPKDRIGVLGPNGAGKSSLIKLLAGELEQTGGVREASPGLKIGYFAQHQVDHLHLTSSPLEHIRRIAANTSEVDLRKFLGSFGFSGDVVFAPVQNFSGGEKSRLALALLVWQKPNLLLLDEPTNHLDLEMRHALSLALQDYQGAMILVSHDRYLVRSTTDKLLLVADGALQDYDGDLNDYQKWLLDYRKNREVNPVAPKKEASSSSVKPHPELALIKQLEEQLIKLEKQYAVIEAALADSAIYDATNKEILKQRLLEQSQLKNEIEKVEAEWLKVSAK